MAAIVLVAILVAVIVVAALLSIHIHARNNSFLSEQQMNIASHKGLPLLCHSYDDDDDDSWPNQHTRQIVSMECF